MNPFRPSTTEPKPRIYPRGTKLADVPPDFVGVSWSEYVDICLFGDPQPPATEEQKQDFEHTHPLTTSRDGHGWRGMRGTSYIGKPAESKPGASPFARLFGDEA